MENHIGEESQFITLFTVLSLISSLSLEGERKSKRINNIAVQKEIDCMASTTYKSEHTNFNEHMNFNDKEIFKKKFLLSFNLDFF